MTTSGILPWRVGSKVTKTLETPRKRGFFCVSLWFRARTPASGPERASQAPDQAALRYLSSRLISGILDSKSLSGIHCCEHDHGICCPTQGTSPVPMTERPKSKESPDSAAGFSTARTPGRWQSLAVMLIVGTAFTVAGLVMLGHFTQPASVNAKGSEAVGNPFADTGSQAQGTGRLDEETCQVMSTTIKDINSRMSQGVTEKQASYFRSRRNKLYQMMRERCGV